MRARFADLAERWRAWNAEQAAREQEVRVEAQTLMFERIPEDQPRDDQGRMVFLRSPFRAIARIEQDRIARDIFRMGDCEREIDHGSNAELDSQS